MLKFLVNCLLLFLIFIIYGTYTTFVVENNFIIYSKDNEKNIDNFVINSKECLKLKLKEKKCIIKGKNYEEVIIYK